MSSLPSSSSSSSTPAEKKILTLLTSDNQVIEVEESLAIQAKTIKLMVEDGYGDGVIPLPAVKSKVLVLAIEWFKEHSQEDTASCCKIPKWRDRRRGEGLISLKEWEARFCYEVFRKDEETFFELVRAADYLEAESLLDQLCKHIASLMKGRSTEQIRKIFHIKNDFTPEEEAAVRAENAWAFTPDDSD